MDIVNLVNTLSPAEKQGFKKLNAGEKEYLRLFDYINLHKNFEKEKIKIYLAKHSGKKLEKYTSGYISVLKNYLKEKILESLRLQLINKRPSYEIMIRTLNSEILLEKGLINLAKNELKKAKGIGGDALFPVEKLVISRRESILNYYQNFENITLQNLHDFYKKRLELINQLGVEAKLIKILSIIGFHQFRKIKTLPNIQLLEIDKTLALIDTPANLNFENQYLYYWVKSQLAEVKGHTKEALDNFEYAMLVWIHNPDYITIHPRMYLGACYAYFKLLQKFMTHQQSILKRKDFLNILEKIDTTNLAADELKRYKTISMLHQLTLLKEEEKFEEMVAKIPQVEAIFKYGLITTNYTKVSLNFYLAFAFERLGKTEKALDWINPIFHEKELKQQGNPDIFLDCIYLFLIIHFKLENYRFLQYELKKKAALLKKIDYWNPKPKQFFNILRRFTDVSFSASQHKKNLKQLTAHLIENEILTV